MTFLVDNTFLSKKKSQKLQQSALTISIKKCYANEEIGQMSQKKFNVFLSNDKRYLPQNWD